MHGGSTFCEAMGAKGLRANLFYLSRIDRTNYLSLPGEAPESVVVPAVPSLSNPLNLNGTSAYFFITLATSLL